MRLAIIRQAAGTLTNDSSSSGRRSPSQPLRFPRVARIVPASAALRQKRWQRPGLHRALPPAVGGSGGGSLEGPPFLPTMDMSAQDRAMIRLFMGGCFHYWDQLPELAQDYLAAGASGEQLRGCVRHLVVFAGYGPCLAATLALHKAKLLPENTPAKVSGPPGNAFELVYAGVTDRVRANMHAADPVLGEWIRLHLYGDVYSSPGLDLRRKQLLTCAFLSEAGMHDQLFGHALAGLRFGNSRAALEEGARLACDMGPRAPDSRRSVFKGSLRTLDMAFAKFQKDMAGQPPACPEVAIPDADLHVRIPPLPPLFNAADPSLSQAEQQEAGQRGGTPAAPPAAQAQPGQSVQEQQQPAQQTGMGGAGLESERGSEGGDAVASLGLGGTKAVGGGKPAGWGTSNIARPGSLAVDEIAARMEQQRMQSGLFFGELDEQLGPEAGRQ